MTVKTKKPLIEVLFPWMLGLGALAFIVGLGFTIRWFSAATVQDRVVSPRAGVECLVVSASDGVGVSCYQIPGVRP